LERRVCEDSRQGGGKVHVNHDTAWLAEDGVAFGVGLRRLGFGSDRAPRVLESGTARTITPKGRAWRLLKGEE
jgi:hypothetical protein